MARIFRDCFDMIREVDRELKVSGITVPIKHYQNIELQGEEQLTKELIGVNFVITRPGDKIPDMLRFVFGDEAETIMQYCISELQDRMSPLPLNPGNSYKIRMDLWQKLMSRDKEGKFDYTYSERINLANNQFENAFNALVEDEHSRRAMVMVYTPEDTKDAMGAATRIPCSISYQFLIRNNKLMVVYYIRSNDYYKHFPIDIVLTSLMQKEMRVRLQAIYPSLKLGSLTYFAGSLHAYKSDLDKHVVF